MLVSLHLKKRRTKEKCCQRDSSDSFFLNINIFLKKYVEWGCADDLPFWVFVALQGFRDDNKFCLVVWSEIEMNKTKRNRKKKQKYYNNKLITTIHLNVLNKYEPICFSDLVHIFFLVFRDRQKNWIVLNSVIIKNIGSHKSYAALLLAV